jgi:MtN3 and saliva related transmembrane protein
MSMIFITNLVGYTGMVVGISLMLPQIVKSYRTKKADDLSIAMLALYFFSSLLWLIYGILIDTIPGIIANAAALVISVVQIRFKIRYSRK